MIHIRRMKDTDIEQVNAILKTLNLTFDTFVDRVENLMVIDDNGSIQGFSSFISKNEDATLDLLIVEKSHRGMKLGDGLFKATLNLMEINGIKSVDVLSVQESNGFFEKLDLKAYGEKNVKVVLPYDESMIDKVYFTSLPDFFNTACHSKKG